MSTKLPNSGDSGGLAAYQPVAIVGIGCRFPGGIDSPQTFWNLLEEGRDATGEVPSSRWSADKFYDQNPDEVGKLYAKRGGFLKAVAGFDPQFFGISPREAAYMDPQQRLLLETTWEAFEDAAIPPGVWADGKVGVYMGLFTHDYENLHMRSSEQPLYGPHSATGMSTTIAANRISHAFDFNGPSMVVDTACSSSLVAVHLACRGLQSGDAQIAVAGGVNLQLMPELTMSLCKASMLSPDGRCKSFDATANGYARSDGVGMVVLKPLDKAVADGDSIYAVIHGSAVNQDGRTKGITVPSGPAQKRVMREALARAGVTPGDISYVEAHGTGTPVGDPIEANALGTVLSDEQSDREPCLIGSVKSNFGHTESAAGVAGLIKVALMLRNRRIPPNLHFTTPNPNIPFNRLRLRVPTALESWPAGPDGKRRAGINSFGFGGTNAHVVLGDAPTRVADGPAMADNDDHPSLLCLSARSQDALKATARRHAEFLRSDAGGKFSLDEIAGLLAHGREHLSHRLTAAVPNSGAAANILEAFADGSRRPGLASGMATGETTPIAFVVSGMGQQWWAMGRSLIKSEPVFRDKINELDAIFERLGGGWSLRWLLNSDENTSPIDKTEFAQPAIFSVQVALAALYESFGIRPDFIVGHSIGEVAAAHIAGALTLEDAASVCFHRSRLQATLAGRGGMLAVGLSADEVQVHIAEIAGQINVAANNSPKSVTLVGDTDLLEGFGVKLEQAGIFARMLNVEVPYHSPVMEEIGAQFIGALAEISPQVTSARLVSTVTGEEIDGTTLDGTYWYRNIREPVAFANAINHLISCDVAQFIEIGAHPVLASSIQECLDGQNASGSSVTSLRRNQDDAITFLSAVGQIHCAGQPVDFSDRYHKPATDMTLPTYPWQRSDFWTESDESRQKRIGMGSAGGKSTHLLLGNRQPTPHPTWSVDVRANHPGYLADHKVQGSVVFPAAGYIEMALGAVDELSTGNNGLALEKLEIEAPLVLADGKTSCLQITVDEGQNFEIHSQNRQDERQYWTRHVVGKFTDPEPTEAALDLMTIQNRLPGIREKADIYAKFDSIGLDYGPQFQGLQTIWHGRDEALGRLNPTPQSESGLADYHIHPTILDASFQLLVALPGKGTFLPVGIARIDVIRSNASIAWAHSQIVRRTDNEIAADIVLADTDGDIVAKVSGLACRLFGASDRDRKAATAPYIYDRFWIPAPLDGTDRQNRAAGYIPAASHLANTLQNRQNNAGYDPSAAPAINNLALSYFYAALEQLGWDWHQDGLITEAKILKSLGISRRHFQYVERMLALLADAGQLIGKGDGWVISELPAAPSPQAQWRAAMLGHPDCHAELSLVRKCGAQLPAFLTDTEEPQTSLFAVGSPIAEHLFADSPTFKPVNQTIAEVVSAAIDQLPDGEVLNILEIGAGTGGLTARILPLLQAGRVDYVLTDISPSVLENAKERFRQFPFVRCEHFDIEDDPADQGFNLQSFDVIIGSHVLHATTDIDVVLTTLRDLLAPGGLLAFSEMTAPPVWSDFIFGLLPGWWVFSDAEPRRDHALMAAANWQLALEQAGFEDCTQVKLGDVDNHHSVFLSKRPDDVAQQQSAEPIDGSIEVLASGGPVILLADCLGIADALAVELGGQGRQALVVAMPKPNGHDVSAEKILASVDLAGLDDAPSVVDLRSIRNDRQTSDGISPSDLGTVDCHRVVSIIDELSEFDWTGKPAYWIVTNGVETVGGVRDIALNQSAVRGFARVVMTEHIDLQVRLVDISPKPADLEIKALGQEILAATAEDEIVLRADRRYICRVAEHKNIRPADGADAAYTLALAKQAVPARLVYQETELAPPGPGEVQLRTKALGLNFKDFAGLSGLVDNPDGILGLEGAGVVTAVGEGVDRLALGDAVFGPIDNGLSSPINTAAAVLARMPANMSFEEAGGTPVIFLSAYHALKKQAGLNTGETILIHTATGGVGLAAIQVARMLGATVFATAGSDEKRGYLRDIGVDWVGNSRSAEFADEIMKFTNGRGVDVVLNTLPAAMNEKNIDILRPATGRLIDLSNIHYKAFLDYRAMKKGISVSAFDLRVLTDANHDYIGGLMRELADLFESGALRPVPYRATPLSYMAETLSGFRKAAHIGKQVVALNDSPVDMRPGAQHIDIDANASYMVTGGLSGFGLTTAKWLSDRGARHLVLVGRRGVATPEAADMLARIAENGTQACLVACDVSDRDAVDQLVDRFGTELPPLGGVIHGAMVLADGPARQMSAEQIQAVLAPKIDGAWNLHRATENLPLSFFICYSSSSNFLGNRDQANYAAANEYLEALARYRQANGLPAVAISWGAIGDVGVLARDQRVRDAMNRQGIYDMDQYMAWSAISLGLRAGMPNTIAMLADWPKMRNYSRLVANSPRFNLLEMGRAGHGRGGMSAGEDGTDLDGQLTAEEHAARLQQILSGEVAAILGMDEKNLDINEPLANLGFDSLMAVELVVAVEQATGQELQRMALLRPNFTTADLITEISGDVPTSLATPIEFPENTDVEAPSPTSQVNVEDLSDSEVDALLKELAAKE